MTWHPDVWQEALIHAHVHEGINWIDGFGLHEPRRKGLVGTLEGLTEERWWLPCPGGHKLLLVACYDPWCDGFIDIVAINPARPHDLYFLTGRGTLLGNARFLPTTVRIHRDVTSWLRSPDDLCVLDWSVAPDLFVGSPRLTLECDDRNHGIEALRAFDGVHGIVPRVVYDDETRLAA